MIIQNIGENVRNDSIKGNKEEYIIKVIVLE